MSGIVLRDLHNDCFKVNEVFLRNVDVRRVSAHPCCACGGVDGEDALTGVQKVSGIAGYFKCGECTCTGVLGNLKEQGAGGIIENQYLACGGGVVGALLTEHTDHHIVGGFVDERDHYLLPVHLENAVGVLLHRLFADLPHKIPR